MRFERKRKIATAHDLILSLENLRKCTNHFKKQVKQICWPQNLHIKINFLRQQPICVTKNNSLI